MPDTNETAGSPGIAQFEDELRRVRREPPQDAPPKRSLDNVSFHDFAFYDYLLPVEVTEQSVVISAEGQRFLDGLEPTLQPPAFEIMVDFVTDLEIGITEALLTDLRVSEAQRLLPGIVAGLYSDYVILYILMFPSSGAVSLDRLRSHRLLLRSLITRAMQRALSANPGVSLGIQAMTGLLHSFFFTLVEEIDARAEEFGAPAISDPEYPFDIAARSSVNLGLRLVYRQEWRPLGTQRGEMVRTIPLGPGQKQKVVTKIVRRRKTTTSRETVVASETTTESSNTTKDSNEIVNEAVSASKWNEELDVGGSFLGIGAESKTTFGESDEERSKATSSGLSEVMQKTAAKMRRETKVVVSTEAEETFDREESSEIVNPNNEIAITYEYYKLQHQYEVLTTLAEVESVILVAERIPLPNEVDLDWIRRHDTIIAKVLKDESYRETINGLIHDADEEEDPLANASQPQIFEDFAKQASPKFATFENKGAAPGAGGLSVPDIYSAPIRAYQDHLRERAARGRANRVRTAQQQRLLRHVVDNILHYCRAIWSSEDSDQRILRYRKENRRVPIEWTGPGPRVSRAGAPPVPAQYVPTGNTAPLWELVDPTGPLGYTGNYAVFPIRPLPVERTRESLDALLEALNRDTVVVGLNDVLAHHRAKYVDPSDGSHRVVLDPALRSFRIEADEIASRTPRVLARPTAAELEDILWYLPRLESTLFDEDGNVARDPSGDMMNPISADDYGEYLYRKHGTRRFLVDSNNVYLEISTSEGAALEPFKRAHRYVDVLKAYEELEASRSKNRRRDVLLNEVGAFDPDIQKVVVVGDGSLATSTAAVHTGPGDGGAPAAPSAPPADPNVP